ncbi:MAG: thiamine pyrophosphate-binding protein [Curvibacter lanceolatus]|jgi:acetolactate synthase-1/2/3 large subunit|uniref:thiamine pyrophosphate-binding protein n=1 Tax=Curvibacter lanceolatus TaxID=86182 RepID=UPI00235435A2|nr:thiamine pyrophosphate-binding protein [Curvibacter lanceolatus]MBV5293873.1 thiamine pyrophosphate-binding protein [Curvibacter lanceolatus]
MTTAAPHRITVGELAARFLEQCGVRAAFGVISIHNMPILDAFHRRQKIRFVSARGEAGACNMADAYARVSGALGVCVTSTGTGAGNAAGAMIEALTAGTPMLHLTGQIESPYLDRDLGYIHEAPAQLAMLQSVGKAAFRIRNAETALATLREAARLAFTPPCGPVSIEIPIDVQATLLDLPADLRPLPLRPVQPEAESVQALADALAGAKRPLLWLGGGARGASAAVARFVKLGWGVVTSVQGRGILAEDHPASLGSYNLQKPAEDLYQSCDALLVVGSRLRSNETLRYKLKLPQALYRIDANALAHNRGYNSQYFVQGDAELTLNALADLLEGRMQVDPQLVPDVQKARAAAAAHVDDTLGAYTELKNQLADAVGKQLWWVRDITLSNSMWGNRAPVLDHPRAGVHALGGGIGQGLAMAIGTSVANTEHQLGRKTVALVGDGGFMLNVGELACAVQENADLVVLLMNDSRYGVIKNIQDDIYGSRHCYVELHTPDFANFCASLQAHHFLLDSPARTAEVLGQALAAKGPVVVEVDMKAWGPFAAKFAGPILKKEAA